jgi:hypothetical protein
MKSAGAFRGCAIALVPLLLLAGCGGPDAGSSTYSQTDSAGVTIVESIRPLWKGREGWKVGRDPDLSIGITDGDERYLLNDVRGVRRMSDGRIAVLDQGSFRVRVYDRTGEHLMDLGGEGDGPSEFRTPQFMGLISDTLFVYEAIGGSLTWFAPDGEFLRVSQGFSQADRSRGTFAMLGNVGERVGIGVRHGAPGYHVRDTGIDREPWSIWRFDLENRTLDSLFSVPGGEVEIVSSDGRGTLQRRYVFGKWTCLAISKDRIFVAPTDQFSIREYDEQGALRRIIRRPDAPRRVSRSDFNHWVDRTIETRDADREEKAEMRRNANQLQVAETMPAFRAISVDSEDNLWVEEWEDVGLEQGRFSVFRPDGAWLGYVEVREGLTADRGWSDTKILEIGSDYILGVWADDLGVEQVRLYRIEKQ